MLTNTLQGSTLSLDLLNDVVACPLTKQPIRLSLNQDVSLPEDGRTYVWRNENWELIPEIEDNNPLWKAWEQLQENGMISYQSDPGNNLAVGKRQDCEKYGQFCQYQGLVLDIGCGPQTWPAYFPQTPSPEQVFIGVDPLIKKSSEQYWQLRALAEYLPLRGNTMDRVLFSTSLDHMVDPVGCLKEAKRVCKPTGTVCVWIGEKKPNTPKPQTSPQWYQDLKKPDGAEDVFHIKRFTAAEIETFFEAAGLSILESEIHPIDEFRTNHFYRLSPQ